MDKNKYDIGFSFQMDDIGIVERIYHTLSPNYKIFFAPQKQEELFTQDQANRFGEIFKSTKINFIFLGPQYGKTKWTRFEEDIIKYRAIDEGWHTVGVIKTAKVDSLKWYPPNNAYIKYFQEDYPVFIGILKYCISHVGVHEHEESVDQLLQRKKGEAEVKKRIEEYPNTLKAFSDSRVELTKLLSKVKEKLEEISAETPTGIIRYDLGYPGSFITPHLKFRSNKYFGTVEFLNDASNQLSNHKLVIKFLELDQFNNVKNELSSYLLNVTLNTSLVFVWKFQNSEKHVTTDQLIDFIIRHWIETIHS